MKRYYLSNCSIYSLENNNWKFDKNILISDGRIIEIINKNKKNKTINEINLNGGHIVPGLIDSHVHICNEGNTKLANDFNYLEPKVFSFLRAAKNLEQAFNNGITTIRDVGSYKRRAVKIRDVVNKGVFPGPKIIPCGNIITSVKGHVHEIGREVKGISQCRKAVKEEIENGAGFIKITNDPIGLNQEEINTIVNEAHKHGKLVACHAFNKDSIQMALDARVDTIEHGSPFSNKMARQMMQQGTILVPTYHCSIETCKDVRRSLISDENLSMFKDWRNNLKNNLPRAIKMGVKIAIGTDAGYPPLEFNSAIEEIISMTHLGAKPIDALRYATSFSAEACGLPKEHINIEDGTIANMVVCKENPLKNIETLRDIKFTIFGNRIINNMNKIGF